MHGHESVPQWASDLANVSSTLLVGMILFMVAFVTGLLPVPVGYERGKVKFVIWCTTGMHPHHVYWTERGFQTLHPADRTIGDVQ